MEDLNLIKTTENVIDKSVRMSEIKQSKVEQEIAIEKRKLGERAIFATMEIETGDLNNFNEKLNQVTKSLPKYQLIERQLANIKKQDLPYELFKILKQESDEAHFKADDLQDGVLIKSMKQGNLECAGRTLIASTYLQGQNIEHVVVSAPGHALLIIEQPSDTLIYFDANNNLYFTFPKSALDGYQGTGVLAECRLKEFTPREIDVADGISTAYSHFISMPAKEGVGRQYLGNVAAALKGNKEFVASGIGVDEEASQAVRLIENEIYGENKVFDNFYSKIDQLKKIEELQIADERKIVDEIMRDHSTHDDFITFFVKVLDGNMANRIPYIKNASLDNKKAFAEKLWNYIQKRNVK